MNVWACLSMLASRAGGAQLLPFFCPLPVRSLQGAPSSITPLLTAQARAPAATMLRAPNLAAAAGRRMRVRARRQRRPPCPRPRHSLAPRSTMVHASLSAQPEKCTMRSSPIMT